MNFAEILRKLLEKRDSAVDQMSQIHQKSIDEARVFDESENVAFKALQDEVEALDRQIENTKSMEKMMASRATPVDGQNNGGATAPPVQNSQATKSAGGAPTRVPYGSVSKSNLPKGTVFTRYAMALAASKGNLHMAAEIAKSHWGQSTPEVETILKAAVAAGTTTDANWAKPLVEYQNATAEFIELLRPETILGRIQGFRRVPFNVRIPRQTSGSSVGWVGQGLAKPVGKLSFDSITVPPTKIAGIVVITQELARFSQPSAEALVRQDMIATIAQFMDQQFIDPAVAGVTNVSPASITNGVTAIASTGDTVADIIADTNAALLNLTNTNINPNNFYWVMSPRSFIYLQTLRTAQDVYAFPELQNAQPRFRGYPVIVTTGVAVNGGAGTNEAFIALIAASEILLADDGEVLLDTSTEAAVAMDTAGAGALTSLWQNNLIGIRAERFVHWMARRSPAVSVIGGVTY